MSAGKIVAGVLVAVGLGGLAYWAVTSKVKVKKDEEPTTPNSPSPTSPTSPTSPSPSGGTFPLVVGMKNNADVKKMQKALIDKFAVIIMAGATGNFGPQTVQALKEAGYLPIISKADYDAILKGLRKGDVPQDPNALKKGDMVRASSYADIYALGGGVGTIGWLKRGTKAKYDGNALGGWSKITTIEHWVKGPKDSSGNPTEVYKFNQRVAYVRTHLIQKV